MTQIVVTLENGADSSLLQRMIENMKGVLSASVRTKPSDNAVFNDNNAEWIAKMKDLSNRIDSSVVDMSDDRTRYIMSK